MNVTTTTLNPLQTLVAVAVCYSRQTRRRVLDHVTFVTPARVWERLSRERDADGSRRALADAGRELIRLATPTALPFVRRGVRNVLRAVRELDGFSPEYCEEKHVVPAAVANRMGLGTNEVTYSMWEVVPASVARLDELRNRLRVRFVELASLFEEHNGPMERLLSVMRRTVGFVLPPTTAAIVGEWVAKMEKGDAANG